LATGCIKAPFPKTALSQEDYEELYVLMKKEIGLPFSTNINSIPLDSTHIPAQTSDSDNAVLLALYDLKNVIELRPSQKLEFCPKVSL
jgi:hypothetical protein